MAANLSFFLWAAKKGYTHRSQQRYFGIDHINICGFPVRNTIIWNGFCKIGTLIILSIVLLLAQ